MLSFFHELVLIDIKHQNSDRVKYEMDLHAWKAPVDVKNSGCHISGPGPCQAYTASNTKLWGRAEGGGGRERGKGRGRRLGHHIHLFIQLLPMLALVSKHDHNNSAGWVSGCGYRSVGEVDRLQHPWT